MEKTRIYISIAVIALVLTGGLLLFYGGISGNTVGVDDQEDERVVRIGYLPIISSLNLFIAQEEGYFTERGIEIETIQLQSSNQLVDAIVRGDIDIVAATSSVPVLVADTIDPGKMSVFSTSEITSEFPSDALLVKKESEIDSLADLEGMKIGVFPGSTSKSLLKDFLVNKGVDVSKIEFMSLTPTNQLPALYSGSIDVLQAYEPTITVAVQSGNVKKIYGSVYAEQLSPNPLAVSVISNKFVSENPKLAKKTVDAFNEAHKFMKESDAESRDIVSKYTKVDRSVAEEVVFRYMSQSHRINKQSFQSFADLLYEIGELEKKIDALDLLYSY